MDSNVWAHAVKYFKRFYISNAVFGFGFVFCGSFAIKFYSCILGFGNGYSCDTSSSIYNFVMFLHKGRVRSSLIYFYNAVMCLVYQFYIYTLQALLNRSYPSLEWALSSPPKPHAFLSLPLESRFFSLLILKVFW